MTTIERWDQNPILTPADVPASRGDFMVECLLNPGAFRYRDLVGLLMRVAERPQQERGWISTPVLDPEADDGIRIMRFRKDDPDVDSSDPRLIGYRGEWFLTTLSHLRLAWSRDGRSFEVAPKPTLIGEGTHETFGIEDARVTLLEEQHILTFTSVSTFGVGVGMASTTDWQTFRRHGIIFPPHNKDAVPFPRQIQEKYFALHRPSGLGLGGHFIWIAESPDLVHWGGHQCILRTRPGHWDSERVGAGAAPIYTPDGWLVIYHGSDHQRRYCLGAALLDLDNPSVVLARSVDPLLEPETAYERTGFLGGVVFTNGHVFTGPGDQIWMYYGAADHVICGATVSIRGILATMREG